MAAVKETSRYAAPFMEGKFSDNPDEDCSLDPVGVISAVRALVLIFKGKSIEEDKFFISTTMSVELSFENKNYSRCFQIYTLEWVTAK